MSLSLFFEYARNLQHIKNRKKKENMYYDNPLK